MRCCACEYNTVSHRRKVEHRGTPSWLSRLASYTRVIRTFVKAARAVQRVTHLKRTRSHLGTTCLAVITTATITHRDDGLSM
jgi:hypothetical protein